MDEVVLGSKKKKLGDIHHKLTQTKEQLFSNPDGFYYFLQYLKKEYYIDEQMKDKEKEYLFKRLNVILLSQIKEIFALFANFFGHYIRFMNREEAKRRLKEAIDVLKEVQLISYFEWMIVHYICEIYDFSVINSKGFNDKNSHFLDISLNDKRLNWVNNILSPFLLDINCQSWLPQIVYYTENKLSEMRIHKLYFIIASFPSSLPAIKDIQTTTNIPVKRSEIAHFLNEIIHLHILKPTLLNGLVHIRDCIKFFINAMSVLYTLDSTGILSQLVLQAIQVYLKKSPLSTKLIAMELWDLQKAFICSSAESAAFSGSQMLEAANPILSYDIEGLDWSPDPIEETPLEISSYFKTKDISLALVDCSKSKMFLFEELQKCFGKLLLKNEHPLGTEILIQMLFSIKSKLGATQFQGCEIMIRDLAQSFTLNNAINTELQKLPESFEFFSVDVLVLSHLYWTVFEHTSRSSQTDTQQSFKLPPVVLEKLIYYENFYKTHKFGRYIEWLPAAQTKDYTFVTLTLEFEYSNRSISFNKLPAIDAVVIMAFQNGKNMNSLEEIKTTIEASDDSIVLESLQRWISRKVLSHDDQKKCYVLNDE